MRPNQNVRCGRYALVCIGLGIDLAAASCGIREYPHDLSKANPNADLTVLPATMDAGVLVAASQPDAFVMPPADANEHMQPPATDVSPGRLEVTTSKLVLNGVALPKEDVIAIIHFGHSNMEGRATGPEEDVAYNFSDVDSHGWMYRVGSMPLPALEPHTACALDNCPGAGPGTELIKQAIARAPKKYFLSLGFGRPNARCSQYLPGALYFDEATKAAIALKDIVTFAGIVVMLGLPELTNEVADPHKGFVTCMTNLIAGVRDAVGQPELPVLLSDYEMGASGRLAPSTEHAKSIIAELHKLPSVIPRLVIVPTDGLPMQDDHHFNLEGHRLWTQRVLDLMQEHGWFPWAEPAGED